MTAESYGNDTRKGLVALSALWGRTWKCAQFENGQLRSFGFDRLPPHQTSDHATADVSIESASLHAEGPAVNYVLALEPGEYALATFAIQLALSVSDVQIASVGRVRLLREGKPIGGTFTVYEGELVYIGHFGLDCYKEPTIWRYYLEGRDGFQTYKNIITQQYPFLDVSKMQFRLFKTSALGRGYELPQ